MLDSDFEILTPLITPSPRPKRANEAFSSDEDHLQLALVVREGAPPRLAPHQGLETLSRPFFHCPFIATVEQNILLPPSQGVYDPMFAMALGGLYLLAGCLSGRTDLIGLAPHHSAFLGLVPFVF